MSAVFSGAPLFAAGPYHALRIWTVSFERRHPLFPKNGAAFLSLTYFVLVVTVLMPLLIYAFKTNWHMSKYLFAAAISIMLALLFRTLDHHPWTAVLPMGSHFLWHIFGALTCHFLFYYVYYNKPIPRRD